MKLHITAATASACMEFAQYLHTLEPQMPGISGSLRSLMPTLIFGLSIFHGYHRAHDSMVPGDFNSVLAELSRALAQRMVSHRRAMLHAEQSKRLQSLAAALSIKLQEAPHTVRQLTRRCNRLSVAECRDALQHLASMGAAVADGDMWHLTTGPELTRTINIETTTTTL